MSAVCAELKGEPGELDGARFDIIVVRLSISFVSVQFADHKSAMHFGKTRPKLTCF